MNESRKRNIIIGVLCGVLLLMAVGYAAFQSVLNIEGTANITSNWDIKITNIEEKEHVGSATSASEPTHEDLTATFSVNLVSPGDSISYDVTIENQGNLDAELARIKVNKGNNPAIKFETDGISEGDILETGGSATLNVKITYDESVTSQPDNTGATFKVTLDYVQQGHKSEWNPSDAVNVGGKYVIPKYDGTDGLYADPNPAESGRYVYAGANPDNYITFNGEEAGWRIVSVETDGAIKIMRRDAVNADCFDYSGHRKTGYCESSDSGGCNVWAATPNYDNHSTKNNGIKGAVETDSSIKNYLNGEYYNSITTNQDAIMENHSWNYGAVDSSLTSLSAMVEEEDDYKANSNVGLISLSDVVKSNTNTNQCGSVSAILSNGDECTATTWVISYAQTWTITPYYEDTDGEDFYYKANESVYTVISVLGGVGAAYSYTGVVPSLYLKPTIQLQGSGTKGDPYTIKAE